MAIEHTFWDRSSEGWTLYSTFKIKGVNSSLGRVDFNEGAYSSFSHDGTNLGTFGTLHEAQQEVEDYLVEFI